MIPPLDQSGLRAASGHSIAGRLALLIALAVIFIGQAAQAGAEPVSFQNDVMAILSKAGCNMGVCHGNQNGKGGFKLSLRGQDPRADLAALTRDQLGRRVDRLDPKRSLVLLKPTMQVAHQGALRFEPSSELYEILHRWIADGARPDEPGTPRLERIEVEPLAQVVVEPDDRVQLAVRAYFSDGSRRDVSRLAVYETSNQLVEVTPGGLAERRQMGDATVLVRYLHLQAPVRLSFVPARPDFAWSGPPETNYIDRHVFTRLRALRMNPSALSTDSVFLRRAYLDLLGILPTANEARRFLADTSSDKRSRLIDELLERPEFADWWALKWSDLLRNEEKVLDFKGVQNFHHWIRRSIADNKPLDQFVRELVAARGSTYTNPAANFYRANRDPTSRAETAAQVFLGVRLGCARCHNHPFDRWTQADYYSWAALFSRVRYKIVENRRRDENDSHEFDGEQIVWMAAEGEVVDPGTGRPAPPRFLDAGAPATDDDPLDSLARWLTSAENPYFARMQANRIWYHLLGRGVVDPIDDFRSTNPPINSPLLEALAQDFIASGFDLRHVVRTIMNSRTYQLSSVPNETNAADQANFSHAQVARLSAEQLLDALSQVTGAAADYGGFPPGIRAGQLPGVGAMQGRRQRRSTADSFLVLFGKPPRLLACECERSTETTLAQAFQLVSGPALNEMITRSDNRLQSLLVSGRPAAEWIDELYLAALARPPSTDELQALLEQLEQSSDRRQGLEDLLWALVNSKEFLLRQ